MTRTGVAAGGNWILDHVKLIETWPEQETVARIIESRNGNGGCSYNLLKDLRLLDCPFPLHGFGLLGRDADAQYILEDCRKCGIEASGLTQTDKASTSYCDVFTDRRTARRTFFHDPGANALLDVEHFHLGQTQAKIFHLGYLALLEGLDRQRTDGKTGHEVLLASAKALGMVTAADVASCHHPRFAQIVTACSPLLDYLIINEIEAGLITGSEIRSSKGLEMARAIEAAKQIFAGGISGAVVIHFSEGAVAVGPAGKVYQHGACRVPSSYIQGTAGAGDAFSAGFLLGVHEGWEMSQCLELATCSAAVSLGNMECSAALKPWKSCLETGREWNFTTL